MPLFHYLLDTTICNAYLLSEHHRKAQPLYNPTKRIRGTHRAFREALIDALLLQHKPTPERIYTSARHLPITRLDQPRRIHQKIKCNSKGRCQFCRFRRDMLSTRFGHIGGIGKAGSVRQSRIMCGHCSVYLCSNCFELFHDFKSIL
jgi:hypothetical protein